jgi:predicted SprT family Zn-dependent metalloprotease
MEIDAQKLAEGIHRRFFPHLPGIEIRVNPRLRKTSSRFVLPLKGNPYIEVADWFKRADVEVFENVLKHEFLHYELYCSNGRKNYGHTKAFLKRAHELGIQ